MNGFFAKTEITTKAPPTLVPRCGQCKLFEHCHSPKMKPDGRGRKGILIIGEAPGAQEDQQGHPFVGPTGSLLQRTLAKFDVDMRRDCWLHNALACKPQKDSNDIKDPKAIDHCRPNVLNAIRKLQPETIILLGASAVKSLIGWLWREEVGSVNRWIGWKIPCQKLNTWICPAWHPAYILRGNSGKQDDTMQMLFEQHIEAALQLEGRPWAEKPDYANKIQIVLDDEQADRELLTIIARDKPIAFDFETDRLKPDREEARIYSCAVSNGETTIAYPWAGKAIQRTKDLLLSNIPKWGYNIKFETRFTIAKLGIRVKNWKWDGMLAAHVLDNRGEITSLKFQSFVLLGVGPYDEVISPYLKAKGGANEPNRIKEVGLPTLLRYNGMDALLEWEVAQKQMEMMGS